MLDMVIAPFYKSALLRSVDELPFDDTDINIALENIYAPICSTVIAFVSK
jgi:hypothetical protein